MIATVDDEGSQLTMRMRIACNNDRELATVRNSILSINSRLFTHRKHTVSRHSITQSSHVVHQEAESNL